MTVARMLLGFLLERGEGEWPCTMCLVMQLTLNHDKESNSFINYLGEKKKKKKLLLTFLAVQLKASRILAGITRHRDSNAGRG